ncbi:DUF2235 domain-containing protein [Mycena indigotica]|uniref:DUF2235 domain-containing protein n=1 Tax=Mycena indigotica TaxID=2126181 RepID=A0A8H6TEK2_9AGAR|nr:DUF2235 domain-containing protein [Mycena indigotica]KAF7316268.1 DUF2235 domain-containing protein [Mycena indigotica]
MNFQSLPSPLPRLKPTQPPDVVAPGRAHLCGCRCVDSCSCACACASREHCSCRVPCGGECGRGSRNLVVSLDSVSKAAKKENSTVLELHTQILVEPNDNQLAYYDSGVGHGPSLMKDVLFAWRHRKTIMNAYRWLCEHYRKGDRIYLFGFSHGAYTVQTLASMIDMVGLVDMGNQRFMKSAYDIFNRARDGRGDVKAAAKFRSTFARKVQVHFVGVWETSQPTIVFGQCPKPSMKLAERVCIFRQALALDEVGVKCSSVITQSPNTAPLSAPVDKGDTGSVETKIGSEARNSPTPGSRVPRRRASSLASSRMSRTGSTATDVREVWFAGSHKEMGAGLKPDAASNLSSVPLSWMENEATSAGLRLRSRLRDFKSQWDALQEEKHPFSSLRRMLQPRKRRKLRAQPRTIYTGQLLHASIAFQNKDYRPQAVLDETIAPIDWELLVGQHPLSSPGSFQWALTFGDRLDFSFFDRRAILQAMQDLSYLWKSKPSKRAGNEDRASFLIERLSFMALSGHLCETYLTLQSPIWNDDRETELELAVKFFQRLADNQPAVFIGDLAEILETQCRFVISQNRKANRHIDVERQLEEALRLRRLDTSFPVNRPLRAYKLAASLVASGSFIASQKPQKALFFFDESVEVLRPLLDTDFSLLLPHLVLLQQKLGTCVQSLGHDTSAVRVCEAVVALSRELMELHPQCGHVLAAALHDLAFGFNRIQSAQEPHAADECVGLYRSLADDDPPRYARSLADALHNYSRHLLLTNQIEQAHAASLEELHLRRKWKESDGLDDCLEQLARCLIDMGKVDAALETADEVVQLRRRTIQDESKLSDALHVQSYCLALASGRTNDALNFARQAVSTQRGLANSPTKLAILLMNLSVGLSETGNHAESLRAAQEAVKIRAEGWGDDADCALSLGRMAVCLRNVGQLEETLAVADKCLELVDTLVINENNPQWEAPRTEGQLAETLCALSFCFADSPGRSALALQVASQSASRFRKLLAKSHSMMLETSLLRALVQWSLLLVLNDQQDAALRIAVEAAQIGAGSVPKELYAHSLLHLSTSLYAVGKAQQASAPAQKAVDILRELVAEHSDSWHLKEQLVDALFNASLYPSHPPSFTALQAIREGVGLHKVLKAHIPNQRFEKRLADGLQNLAARALLAGEYDEALSASEEAVGMARGLANSNLVNVLYTHANVLCEQGRYDEAYKLVQECDSMEGDSTVEAAAAYMSSRARCLLGLARRAEGVRALMEGMRLYRSALESPLHRSMFESFPWFLNNMFACISALGRTNADALNATSDLVELARLLTESCSGDVDHYLKLVLEYQVGSLTGH